MARQVTVTLVDDFDGKSEATETVHFAIDGTEYELDLSVLNASKLRGVLEPWSLKARKRSRLPRGKINSSRTRPAVDREQTAAIRQWAKEQGHNISSRGRISAEIVEAYTKAAAK